MPNATTSPWSPVSIQYLQDKLALRWSATQIADGLYTDLGFVTTRCAVVSKARRISIGCQSTTPRRWSEAEVERVRALCLAGHSLEQIANMVNTEFGANYGAGAIRGVQRRYGLERVIKTRPHPPKPRHRSSKAASYEAAKAAAQAYQFDETPLQTSKIKTLLDLEFGDCKWPIHCDDLGRQLFCAAPMEGEGPYCVHHRAISVLPALISPERGNIDVELRNAA